MYLAYGHFYHRHLPRQSRQSRHNIQMHRSQRSEKAVIRFGSENGEIGKIYRFDSQVQDSTDQTFRTHKKTHARVLSLIGLRKMRIARHMEYCTSATYGEVNALWLY